MQSVLFTVFKADSVEISNYKYMGRDASGRLKSAYSATENSYNIEKKSCCKLCCLCFVSLPHGAVGLSGVCHCGIF